MLKDEKMSVGRGEGGCPRPRVACAAPAFSPALAGDLGAEVQPAGEGTEGKDRGGASRDVRSSD